MLFKRIGIISLICMLISCIFLVPESVYLVPIVFVASFVALFLLWAIACIICTRFIDMRKEYDTHSPFYRFFVNCIVESLTQLMNIRLHVSGLEKLPEEKFLLVCNHKAAMDPLLTMGVLRKYNMGFVAKKEIYKIPVICRLMHRCYCLCLDRGNIKEEAKTILRASKYIKEQRASIGIYPEGTRNKEEGLLPFMNGSFKIAKKANSPIVVAVLRNTEQISKHAPFKRTDVYLDFVEVLDKEYVISNNTSDISERARTLIQQRLDQST